jgi:hypothetical protein
MKESNFWRLNQRIFPSTNLVEIILFPSACFVNRTIARFENGVSLIYAVSISDGNTRIELKDDLGVIGWGYTIASALLTLRECHRKLRLPYTAYLAYEAKRASEKTGFVGQFTALLIQAPGADIKDRAYLKIMSETGKAHLEAVYSGLWKIPFVTIPELTANFFLNLTEKQSP